MIALACQFLKFCSLFNIMKAITRKTSWRKLDVHTNFFDHSWDRYLLGKTPICDHGATEILTRLVGTTS